jgi:glycosyltransferase involved in cell wall biosynthesis
METYFKIYFYQAKIIKLFEFIFIFIYIIINLKYNKTNFLIQKPLAFFNHYINKCKYSKIKKRNPKKNIPFISICLPAYNMDKFIGKSLISILNQSFQNFEIIIVNDYSNDTTKSIIKHFQLKDERIKLINHKQNLGVYISRLDAILASKGEYIILMDPDDILLNKKILEDLYNFIFKYNLDIIEYSVICYIEKILSLAIIEYYYHYHNFSKKIIYQSKLSDIFFHKKNLKKFTWIYCRVIWNKIIRRKVLLNSILYIGIDYYKKFFITAEDTLINTISFHFSKNYSNINLPGYMYNIRKFSMTHGKSCKKKKILFEYNHFLYIKKLYNYIKDFIKERKYLHFELIEINKLLIKLNILSKNYKKEIFQFYNKIFYDKFASTFFKDYINNN